MMRMPILLVAAGAAFALVFAGLAMARDRHALWQVVRACVTDFQLTGLPFPCLEVDVASGEDRGTVTLRPPLLQDLIVVPTRAVVGVEDPFLQSEAAPNYFERAWRARSFLEDENGRPPERDDIALVVNSAFLRDQDQLHIHVGCLQPAARRAVDAAAPNIPVNAWAPVDFLAPHSALWAMRVADLSQAAPFRSAARAIGDEIRGRRGLTLAAVAVRVAGRDQFVILASYAPRPGPGRQVGSGDLLETTCAGGSPRSG